MISIDIKNEQHVHEDFRNRNRASSFRDISKTKDYENNSRIQRKYDMKTMRILYGIFAKLFLTET
jgi:hypothetical protein